MKKYLFLLLICVLNCAPQSITSTSAATSQPLSTQQTLSCKGNPVTEIKNINQILPFIDKNTLVIFDIDQTLIMDPAHPGNVSYSIPKLALVEEQTKVVFDEIAKRTSMIIGLTARGYNDENKDDAGLKLAQLGLKLDNKWLDATAYKDVNKNTTNFQRGYKNSIFYTSYSLKSPVIIAFIAELKKHKINFNNIVFVDDALHNITDVSEGLKKENINVCSFYYTFAHNEYNFEIKNLADNNLIIRYQEKKHSN